MKKWKPKIGKLWSPRSIVQQMNDGNVPAHVTRFGVVKDNPSLFEEEEPAGKTVYGRPQPYLSSSKGVTVIHHSPHITSYPSRNHTQRNYGYGRSIVDNDPTEEEYSVYGYVRPKKEKKYSYSASEWSNYNYFYSSYIDKDDDSTLIVKSPESYLTPTSTQIKQKISVYGQDKINRIKEMARVCYFKMIDEKDYLDQDYVDGNKSMPFSSDEYRNRLAIFERIMNEYVPGFTPLEQAIHIHYKIEDDLAHKRGGKTGGGQGVNWTFKREDYADAGINSQLNMNHLSKGRKLEILNKISLIGTFGRQFIVARETGEKLVANSDQFKKVIMREYSQFNQVELYQRILPNFKAKFLNKELIINTPVQRSEKKQILIVLLDNSGSMDDTSKQIWVNAFLIDRFRYVIKGEAEVYFSYFVSGTETLKFHHIKNAKDVEKFWDMFSNYPGGGATDIGRIVNYVADQVKRGKLHNLKVDLSKQKPEILIINDGQDRVGHDSFPYKVNAISLMQFSPELKGLCVATGGKQIKVEEDMKVTSYSREGEKEEEVILS